MTKDEIRSVINEYLSLFDGKNESHEEREKRLTLALDKLALAYHFAEYDFDEKNYPDAPSRDYQTQYQITGPLFPNYGYYNAVSDISVKIAGTSVIVGDAIDDLTDIALDMFEVTWLWENTSIENALWQFRWGYENHWGEHLRNVQLYINAKAEGL